VRIQPAPASPRPSCAALHSSLAKRRPIRAARHPISALDLFYGRLRTRTRRAGPYKPSCSYRRRPAPSCFLSMACKARREKASRSSTSAAPPSGIGLHRVAHGVTSHGHDSLVVP
jgi:hypothetical protein